MSYGLTRRALIGAISAAALLPRSALSQAWGTQSMTQADAYEWNYLADTVMGGVSEGTAGFETQGDVRFLRLAGSVSTANRGGFIQARTELPDGLPNDTSALRLRVRGNGQRYFIHLRTSGTRLPWQYYQAGFETGPDWADVEIPISEFVPSGRMLRGQVRPQTIRSIGLVAYGRDHTADVSLAAIGSR